MKLWRLGFIITIGGEIMAEKNSEQRQGEDGNAGEKMKPYDDPYGKDNTCIR